MRHGDSIIRKMSTCHWQDATSRLKCSRKFTRLLHLGPTSSSTVQRGPCSNFSVPWLPLPGRHKIDFKQGLARLGRKFPPRTYLWLPHGAMGASARRSGLFASLRNGRLLTRLIKVSQWLPYSSTRGSSCVVDLVRTCVLCMHEVDSYVCRQTLAA
jgi:hypothetical protein